MKRINQIRAGLRGIQNSLMDLPPEPSFKESAKKSGVGRSSSLE
jgi:hypothetical protein